MIFYEYEIFYVVFLNEQVTRMFQLMYRENDIVLVVVNMNEILDVHVQVISISISVSVWSLVRDQSIVGELVAVVVVLVPYVSCVYQHHRLSISFDHSFVESL